MDTYCPEHQGNIHGLQIVPRALLCPPDQGDKTVLQCLIQKAGDSRDFKHISDGFWQFSTGTAIGPLSRHANNPYSGLGWDCNVFAEKMQGRNIGELSVGCDLGSDWCKCLWRLRVTPGSFCWNVALNVAVSRKWEGSIVTAAGAQPMETPAAACGERGRWRRSSGHSMSPLPGSVTTAGRASSHLLPAALWETSSGFDASPFKGWRNV